MDLDAERTRLQQGLNQLRAEAALAAERYKEQITAVGGALAEVEGLIQQRDIGVAAAEALCRICA